MAASSNALPQAPRRQQVVLPWRNIMPWVWIAPALVLAGVFLLYPIITTLILSLQNADSTQFVGLKNFARIFTTP
ncbi:MAG TPA: hypothetical protein VKB76_17055, partial [Ktedonobacterales bacterium]|nr:hypothetical protein [Ktedonobacterales bacterium]